MVQDGNRDKKELKDEKRFWNPIRLLSILLSLLKGNINKHARIWWGGGKLFIKEKPLWDTQLHIGNSI